MNTRIDLILKQNKISIPHCDFQFDMEYKLMKFSCLFHNSNLAGKAIIILKKQGFNVSDILRNPLNAYFKFKILVWK
jgi:hypothetical protein